MPIFFPPLSDYLSGDNVFYNNDGYNGNLSSFKSTLLKSAVLKQLVH